MDPSMYRAATFGDVGFLQRIRDGDVSTDLLSHKTPEDNNVLHLAAEFKHISFFKDVPLDKRSPLFWAVNKMGDTPMHIAARVGCAEVVNFLIDHAKALHVRKADDQESGSTYAESYRKLLRMTNLEMHTALHVAARYGHGQVVNSLMEPDPELCSSAYSATESPLFLATCKGFSNIARDILNQSSVSPSFKGINGVTALHAAVTHTYQGAQEIVKIMVSKCPDVIKEQDALGWTPLHYAAFRGNLGAIRLLIQNCDKSETHYIGDNWKMSALHIAAYKGHLEVMKELIQCRPDTCECLNAKDQTILHVAVLGAQSHVVEFIMKEQPELITRLIDRADKEGHTPLHLAVIGQNPEITRMMKLYCRSVDNNAIDKGFSLVFDSFLGEDIKTQTSSALGNRENADPNLPPYNKAEQEGSSVIVGKGSDKLEMTDTSHQERSFGVPIFQEQIRRDFKKFKLHPRKKEAVADNQENVQDETNLLIATLIVTVTFTAAIAPPGGYGDDGKMILRDNTYFRWFQAFNLMSFLFSLYVLLHESILAFLGSKLAKLLRPQVELGSLVVYSLEGMLVALVMATKAMQTQPRKSMSADRWIYAVVAYLGCSGLLAMSPVLRDMLVKVLRAKMKQLAQIMKKKGIPITLGNFDEQERPERP